MARLLARPLIILGLSLFTLATQAEQSCNNTVVATAPDSRFQDYGNGTVTDLSTGLIWKQCAEGLSGPGCATGSAETFTWQAALQHADAEVFAGSHQWRLPNKNELASLLELRCSNPTINRHYFPNTPLGGWGLFWSSSPYAGDSSRAWLVHFSSGWVNALTKNIGAHVRLVRAVQ